MNTKDPSSSNTQNCKQQTSTDTTKLQTVSLSDQRSEAALGGDIIYTADLKVCATVYIRASNIEQAQRVLASLSHTALFASGEYVGESKFTDCFPNVEISEAMTIHGQFDGDILVPRYDLANQIDYS